MFSMSNLSFSNCTDIVISTVVLRLREQLYQLCKKYFYVEPLIVEFGIKTGFDIAYENPREVGADRIANSIAASNLFGPRCVVVDFGTATTFDIIDNRNLAS
jgi:type III pantothenate kinase